MIVRAQKAPQPETGLYVPPVQPRPPYLTPACDGRRFVPGVKQRGGGIQYTLDRCGVTFLSHCATPSVKGQVWGDFMSRKPSALRALYIYIYPFMGPNSRLLSFLL